MKPPALRRPGTCGASGRAASTTSAHAPTTHRARRATNRPRRSKGVTPSSYPRWSDRAAVPSASIEGVHHGRPREGSVQLFLVPFQEPIPFGISTGIVILMLGIVLKSALSTEGGARWVRRITNPNARFLFAFLFVAWAARLRDRTAARPARGRRLALRRAGPDRPLQRLLHHDGPALGGHRGVGGGQGLAAGRHADGGAPGSRRSHRRRTGVPDIAEHIATWESAGLIDAETAGRLRATLPAERATEAAPPPARRRHGVRRCLRSERPRRRGVHVSRRGFPGFGMDGLRRIDRRRHGRGPRHLDPRDGGQRAGLRPDRAVPPAWR